MIVVPRLNLSFSVSEVYMKSEDKVAIDESNRIQQHEEIKKHLREGIHQEIGKAADAIQPDEKARLQDAATGLKDKAIKEVDQTEHELERTKTIGRVSQIIDYIFYIIYSLISLEIILDLFGARSSSGFKQFMDTVSTPFLAPFRGLLFDPGVGPFRLMLSYIFALFFFFLLHVGINRLLRLIRK
jgi:uncharacterized protein YggT (Ycf19 family)